MAEPHVLSALKAKRAEIAGLIDHHQRAINQARADLVHIDAALRIFGYEEDPGAIRAKRPVTAKLFDRGELTRAIFDLLRTAPGGMTGAALAEAIIVRKGWDAGDRAFRAALANKVGAAACRRGREARSPAPDGQGRASGRGLA